MGSYCAERQNNMGIKELEKQEVVVVGEAHHRDQDF